MQDVLSWIVNNKILAISIWFLAIVFIVTYVHRYEVFHKKCERFDSHSPA